MAYNRSACIGNLFNYDTIFARTTYLANWTVQLKQLTVIGWHIVDLDIALCTGNTSDRTDIIFQGFGDKPRYSICHGALIPGECGKAEPELLFDIWY